jgi:hypothetical protein
MGFLYFMSNINRSNLGNANIAGMPEEIGLVGNQFGVATTLLFATYVPFEGPVAVLLKVIGPKLLMSVCAFCWGISSLSMGTSIPVSDQRSILIRYYSIYSKLSRPLCLPTPHRSLRGRPHPMHQRLHWMDIQEI